MTVARIVHGGVAAVNRPGPVGDVDVVERVSPAHAAADAAIVAWMPLYAESLHRFLFSLTGRAEDAEDLVSEVFVQAWRHHESIKTPQAWLFTVARRMAYRSIRRRRRENLFSTVPDQPVGPRDGFNPISAEMLVLRSLRAADREIITLHGQEGLSIKAVAAILRIGEPAAWQRWQRARQRFFDALVNAGEQPPEAWRHAKKPKRSEGARTEEGSDVDV